MKYPIAVLAGGLGTRLGPLTINLPKALVNIYGKPFLYWKLKQLESQGFNKVVICTGYKEELILEYLKLNKFDLDIHISNDGKDLAGTGGAIQRAMNKLGKRFYVTYGDSYLKFHPKKFEEEFEKINYGTFVTYHKNNNKMKNLRVENEKITCIDSFPNSRTKMNAIDYGMLAFTESEFNDFSKESAFHLHSVINSSIQNEVAFGFEVHDNFIDMGTSNGLDSLKKELGEDLKWNL